MLRFETEASIGSFADMCPTVFQKVQSDEIASACEKPRRRNEKVEICLEVSAELSHAKAQEHTSKNQNNDKEEASVCTRCLACSRIRTLSSATAG